MKIDTSLLKLNIGSGHHRTEGPHEFCIRFAFFMMGWQARILQEQRCYAPRS